jgi:hypothetical protein
LPYRQPSLTANNNLTRANSNPDRAHKEEEAMTEGRRQADRDAQPGQPDYGARNDEVPERMNRHALDGPPDQSSRRPTERSIGEGVRSDGSNGQATTPSAAHEEGRQSAAPRPGDR